MSPVRYLLLHPALRTILLLFLLATRAEHDLTRVSDQGEHYFTTAIANDFPSIFFCQPCGLKVNTRIGGSPHGVHLTE
jgi:hypothetical protein